MAYVIFLILVPVLMMNWLIAMMGRTYEIIEEKSLMQWKRQWAMLVLNMEKSVSKGELANHYQTYSTEIKMSWSEGVEKGLISSHKKVNDRKEECYTTHALLVTKQLAKTRAKTKRNAKHKWKWCLKVLKKKGMISDAKNEKVSDDVINTQDRTQFISYHFIYLSGH
ncbi:uncharacterized protein [Amphiura filiformis]|uniref:uncharacterized protein n=1 Tax=Amphiura filiformis TaxID=82378 RepID=UPI003B217E86